MQHIKLRCILGAKKRLPMSYEVLRQEIEEGCADTAAITPEVHQPVLRTE